MQELPDSAWRRLIITQALCDVCAVAETEVVAAIDKLPGNPQLVNLEPMSMEDVLAKYVMKCTPAENRELWEQASPISHVSPNRDTASARLPVLAASAGRWLPTRLMSTILTECTITAPSSVWIETVVVTVEMGYSGTLANTVHVVTDEGATGVYTETCTSIGGYDIYLPAVVRNAQ